MPLRIYFCFIFPVFLFDLFFPLFFHLFFRFLSSSCTCFFSLVLSSLSSCLFQEYNDLWLLDVGVTPAVWSRLELNESASDEFVARWGMAMAFLPNGIAVPSADGTDNSAPAAAAEDTGLTALIFGGFNSNGYLGDILALNLKSGIIKSIQQGSPTASTTQPFASKITHNSHTHRQ